MADGTQDGAEQAILDPDDYNRTKRFEEIHDARRGVADYFGQIQIPDDGRGYLLPERGELAVRVARYVLELEPLIIDSEFGGGGLLPDDVDGYDSLREFGHTLGGRTGGKDPLALDEVIQVYAAANRFYAKIGMDLELGDAVPDAAFEYEDLLQDGPPGSGDAPDMVEGDD